MFFKDSIKRRLASLLRPWLQQEPELELELGLITAVGLAKNLRFDTLVLNRYLFDESSRWSFKDFTVERLSFRVSYWSAPTFVLEIHGVHATLSLGEFEQERGLTVKRKSVDTALEERKKILAELDPEGTVLHEVMQKLSDTISSRNQKTSLLGVILNCCQLQMHGIHLQVQFPISNDSIGCAYDIKELHVESLRTEHGSLLRVLIGSLFTPLQVNYFSFDMKGFEVGLRRRDHISCPLCSTDIFTCIKLKDLELVDFNLNVPELRFSISPAEFSIILAIYTLSSNQPDSPRNGRHLWSIASSRISSLISAPRFSFLKLVGIVCLWLRYVNAYENLLVLVGYPADNVMKKSAVKISQDERFSLPFRKQWRNVSEIEKQLPAESTARARRIARHRAARSDQHAEDHHEKSRVGIFFKFLRRLLVLLELIWSVIHRIIKSSIHLLLQIYCNDHGQIDGRIGAVSENSCVQSCFSLSIGMISVVAFPVNKVQSLVGGDPSPAVGSISQNLLSLCISIDWLFLTSSDNLFQRSFSFSCGNLKMTCSSPSKDGSKKGSNHLGRHLKKKPNSFRNIIWVEPAEMFYFPESNATETTTTETKGTSMFLRSHFGEIGLNWKKSFSKFEGSGIGHLGNPWVLCEIVSSVTDQSSKNLNSGFWKCSLMVGKLNFVLDYQTIQLTALLLRQIQDALCWTSNSGRGKVTLPIQVTYHEPPSAISWDSRCNSYVGEMEKTMLKMLPLKHIQIAVFIAGPLIQMPLGKEGFHSEHTNGSDITRQDDIHLALDIHNIEFSVLPTDFVASGEWEGLDDAGEEWLKFKEPRVINIPESNKETYTCHVKTSLGTYLKFNGLKAYIDDTTVNQQDQIIMLHPVTVKFSSLREDVCSFSTEMMAFSAALHGAAAGLTVLLCMDELFVYVKVLIQLFSAVLCVNSGFESYGGVSFQELVTQGKVYDDSESIATRTKRVPLTSTRPLLLVKGTFELGSMDMVLQNSRKKNNMANHVTTFDGVTSKKLDLHGLPDYGILIYVQESILDFSFEEWEVEVVVDLSTIRSVIFRDSSDIWETSNQSQYRSLLHSLSGLYEIFISHCAFALGLAFLQDDLNLGSEGECSTSVGNISYKVEDSFPASDTEQSSTQSSYLGQRSGLPPSRVSLASNQLLVMNTTISEIYVGGLFVKKFLLGDQKSSKHKFSLSIGRKFQRISCQTQGGYVFFETAAMAMFVECFTSYFSFIRNLLHVLASYEHHKATETGEDIAVQDGHRSQGEQNILQQMIWGKLEVLRVDLSQFSLFVVAADESGGVKELGFETEFHLNLELANTHKRLSFDLSRFSILSQTLNGIMEQRMNEIQIPHFSSPILIDSSSRSVHGDPTVEFQHRDGIHSVSDNLSSSGPHPLRKESPVDKSESRVLHVSRQNYILKQLVASVVVEKPLLGEQDRPKFLDQVWIGGCSITGLELTISLPEIEMLLSTVESLSGVSSHETSRNVKKRRWSGDQESDGSVNETVPDGAIVAIQDVNQHMYMAVEGLDCKYSLVGAVHYSLVRERALFRVKYQKRKRWKSSVLWFSLISLYAKSDSGEALRLNYAPGSGFVDISAIDEGGHSLWRILPCKSYSYDGDKEMEFYNFSARNTFYLVNKKVDCGVAFVDGVPEFVSRVGNPFKWKVFHDFPLAPDGLSLASYSEEVSRSSMRQESDVNEERESGKAGNLPQINVKIDKVILTIVHEFQDTKEMFPLLQSSISTVEFIVQILCSKLRVISTFCFVLYYFDAQCNLWKEFIHPVELCMFYRSRFQIKGSEIDLHSVPVHIYSRIKEFRISVTDLSLDIFLFVIGKLNLAGPYAIKTSTILVNCCKVENQSGLNLLCHFYDNQNASIAGKQSSTIMLRRNLALVNQPPEASYVSIQLADRGAYLTSPISLSLLEARSLAWRTRIVSVQDPRTYPGPFLVVDILRESEDGLSMVVSPLLRIHNETKFSMELRFQRPQQNVAESATVVLKSGDAVDDSVAAFDAINLTGGLKKALMSLSVGNFLFSFRPEITEALADCNKSLSVDWSDDLKGGKAVRISGVFDKLSYRVRKAFLVEPGIVRDIPVIHPDISGYAPGNRDSPVALLEKKEIFILPTVRVFNLLQTDIHVLLTDQDPCAPTGSGNIGNQATVPCGLTVDLYANPATIYFVVTLVEFNSSCKPVNSGDWVKKLQKEKNDVHYLDINLDFGGGKYFALLRLSRGYKGMLEVAVLTSYTLKNDTDIPLLCFAPNQKPLSRDETEKHGFVITPDLGSFLPPKSTRSWFMKYNNVRLKLLEEKASEVQLDLDALSGFTEINLELEERAELKRIAKLGVSIGPFMSKVKVSSQIISMVPRYVVSNESQEAIMIRQCYFEDGMEEMLTIRRKEKIALKLWSGSTKRQISVFEKLAVKHRNSQDDLSAFIQFCPNVAGLSWSGPVCVASLGRFFLKFRRLSPISVHQSDQVTADGNSSPEFAAIHVVEESSSLVLRFHKPPNVNLPYRIENNLHASITYYQKDSSEPEILGSGSSVDYVWDDLTLPRRLVVQINGMNLLREINLDKVRPWKAFYRVSQHRLFGVHLHSDKEPADHNRTSFGESIGTHIVSVGYEIYAAGPTRVLQLSEFRDSHRRDTLIHSSKKIRLRISSLALNLLEHVKQEMDMSKVSIYSPIAVVRLGNINMDSMLTHKHKYNKITVQSLSVDQKWEGAPFAAMLRRHQSYHGNSNDDMIHIVFVLLSSSSKVKQVQYSSVLVRPIDLNLDEETLMRLVPFWRTSLSDSSTQSQQYYFDHFEIHPVKIIASFLPGDSYSSYSSAQEMLRSLLHSVVKIPAIKHMTVELNGVLVTHALITIRELFIKCGQHYSWYATRAIYMAKGSPLLPPAFASIFDDLASSSLDVFFDPSSGLVSIPGLTIGTFKLISKCIDGRGFSGTKRYLGDLGQTIKTAGSNILFAAVTEISDSVLKGAEASGFNGMVNGFHQGILKLAMEPSVLSAAFMEGGPNRKIVLDQSPGIDELYIEGYLQAMLDTIYKQEYLRVRVIDNQVFLKNLPPNSSLIEEIMDRVKGFLVSKALLKGDSSVASQPLYHRRGDSEWKIRPTVLTLCEHLFVSFAIRQLRRQACKFIDRMKGKKKSVGDDQKAIIPATAIQGQKMKLSWKWGIGKFVLSGVLAYVDGRLCRSIPHPVARRIVSGFLLSFVDQNNNE